MMRVRWWIDRAVYAICRDMSRAMHALQSDDQDRIFRNRSVENAMRLIEAIGNLGNNSVGMGISMSV